MRFLFVKTALGWPRYSGHDVHGYYMMKALASVGHEVALLTQFAPSEAAIAGLSLIDSTVMPGHGRLDEVATSQLSEPEEKSWKQRWSWRQERFRSYWGIDEGDIRFTRDHAERLQADAVVVVGMEVLPYLTEIRSQQRIWYAADEWMWHHLSLLNLSNPETWSNVKSALLLGLYENSFASVMDRAWVVSETDRRALRVVTAGLAVDVLPNGVDASDYPPSNVEIEPCTCTFWGNLSFIPNEQALTWFCREVWPLVLRDLPDARFSIYGFQPSETVEQLGLIRGVSITPDVPDIASAVGQQAVVVLPFWSGGGVKNKLLEAAAMSKPIVCSPRACNGLNGVDELPFHVVSASPEEWASALQSLWADKNKLESMGVAARQWVLAHHSWNTSALAAVDATSEGMGTSDGV